jgi:hypothetical protein
MVTVDTNSDELAIAAIKSLLQEGVIQTSAIGLYESKRHQGVPALTAFEEALGQVKKSLEGAGSQPSDAEFWLSIATTFQVANKFYPVEICRHQQEDGSYLWSVMSGHQALNRQHLWEYSSRFPSNRDEEFYTRCRFATKEEALAAYHTWEAHEKAAWGCKT